MAYNNCSCISLQIYNNGLNFPTNNPINLNNNHNNVVVCERSRCLWDLVKHHTQTYTQMIIQSYHTCCGRWNRTGNNRVYQYQYTISNDSIELNRLKSNCVQRWIQIFMRIVKLISYLFTPSTPYMCTVYLIFHGKNGLAFIIGQVRRKMVTKT